jgi:hypothetical protein
MLRAYLGIWHQTDTLQEQFLASKEGKQTVGTVLGISEDDRQAEDDRQSKAKGVGTR